MMDCFDILLDFYKNKNKNSISSIIIRIMDNGITS